MKLDPWLVDQIYLVWEATLVPVHKGTNVVHSNV